MHLAVCSFGYLRVAPCKHGHRAAGLATGAMVAKAAAASASECDMLTTSWSQVNPLVAGEDDAYCNIELGWAADFVPVTPHHLVT